MVSLDGPSAPSGPETAHALPRPGKVAENVHALTFQKANERAIAEAVLGGLKGRAGSIRAYILVFKGRLGR